MFKGMNLVGNNLLNDDKQNHFNNISNNEINVIFISGYNESPRIITVKKEERILDLIKKYLSEANLDLVFLKLYEFIFNGKNLNLELFSSIAKSGLTNHGIIFIEKNWTLTGAGYLINKVINIKFIRLSENCPYVIPNNQLTGLLKLCLLKEISYFLSDENLKKLPDLIKCIMKILREGYIEDNSNIKQNIIDVLKKIKGKNIINFSDYVDETIDSKQIDKMMNLLGNKGLTIINSIIFHLSKYSKYIKFFEKEFEKAKRESIFEFSIISLVIMEREDFETFERERNKCPNRVDKILYHGTSIEPISCILTNYFKKSEEKCYQHGKGVYFTDFLDYCWFYGGEKIIELIKIKFLN